MTAWLLTTAAINLLASNTTFVNTLAAALRAANATDSINTQLAATLLAAGSANTNTTKLPGMIGTDNAWTAAALANAPGGGSGLSGPAPVTITFQDSSSASVATVQFTITGQGSGRANPSGVAAFGMVTGSGYTLVTQTTNGIVFPTTTFTVGATGATFTVTGYAQQHISPTPGEGQVVMTGVARDAGGNLKPTAIIEYKILAVPAGESGNAFSSTPLVAAVQTDSTFTFLAWPLTTIATRCDSGNWFAQTVPVAGGQLQDFR